MFQVTYRLHGTQVDSAIGRYPYTETSACVTEDAMRSLQGQFYKMSRNKGLDYFTAVAVQEKPDNQVVAKEILSQLGGSKFIAMTGSYNFTSDPCALCMCLRANKSRCKWLKVTLTAMDTYSMEFMAPKRGGGIVTLHEFHGVYAEMLRPNFTLVTGFDTSL